MPSNAQGPHHVLLGVICVPTSPLLMLTSPQAEIQNMKFSRPSLKIKQS